MKKKIPYGTKLPVYFSEKEVDLIREHTFYPESENLVGLMEKRKIKVMFSLDDIEDLHGYVAAEANHTEDKKLQNALDKILNRLYAYFIEYDDQE